MESEDKRVPLLQDSSRSDQEVAYATEVTYEVPDNKDGSRPIRMTKVVEPRSTAFYAQLVIVFYFGLWYALNISYNIYNKRALNNIPLYWTAATFQLAVGAVYCFVLWGFRIRAAPVLSWNDYKPLIPLAFFNMCGHVGAVVSLGAGAVSFTHIVKSAEPVFTSLLSGVILHQIFKWPVYVTLIPIISGVAIASMTELDFSWVSFIAAMVSNVAFALRAVLSKVKMGKPVGKNMDAANLFGVLNALSFVMLTPITLCVEGWKIKDIYQEHIVNIKESTYWLEMLLAGISFYLYNEVAFLALDKVHPITHAVGNTFKRVVIIVVSVIVFGNTVTVLGAIGCTIAILGTLLYSFAKQYFG